MSDAKKRAAAQPEHEGGEHAPGERTVPNVLGVNGPPTPAAAQDAPARRPEAAQVNNAYPRAMYRRDGYFQAAESEEEEARLLREGWSRSYIPPRTPQSMQGNVQSSGLDPLALLLREVIESVLDERGLGERPAHRQPPMQWIGARGKERNGNGAQG